MQRRTTRKKYNILSNRLVLFLIVLYGCGFFFGLFARKTPIVSTNNTEKHPVLIFFNIFLTHYWYIFVTWLMGLCIIGFFINIISTFFRGLLCGVLIAALINLSFSRTIVMLIIELILFTPFFLYLIYTSSRLAISNLAVVTRKRAYNINLDMKTYLNIMLLMTFIIVIYSIILTVI